MFSVRWRPLLVVGMYTAGFRLMLQLCSCETDDIVSVSFLDGFCCCGSWLEYDFCGSFRLVDYSFRSSCMFAAVGPFNFGSMADRLNVFLRVSPNIYEDMSGLTKRELYIMHMTCEWRHQSWDNVLRSLLRCSSNSAVASYHACSFTAVQVLIRCKSPLGVSVHCLS